MGAWVAGDEGGRLRASHGIAFLAVQVSLTDPGTHVVTKWLASVSWVRHRLNGLRRFPFRSNTLAPIVVMARRSQRMGNLAGPAQIQQTDLQATKSLFAV